MEEQDLTHIYAIYQNKFFIFAKTRDMNTVAARSKRKIINLKEDTFKALSVTAVQQGTNLKNFIETTLDRIAENYDDGKLYAYLTKEYPDGKEPLNDKEKEKFENWLGV